MPVQTLSPTLFIVLPIDDPYLDYRQKERAVIHRICILVHLKNLVGE